MIHVNHQTPRESILHAGRRVRASCQDIDGYPLSQINRLYIHIYTLLSIVSRSRSFSGLIRCERRGRKGRRIARELRGRWLRRSATRQGIAISLPSVNLENARFASTLVEPSMISVYGFVAHVRSWETGNRRIEAPFVAGRCSLLLSTHPPRILLPLLSLQ